MNARSLAALRIVFGAALAAPLVAACGESEDPKKKALSTAGGLSESQWPKGLRGDTPAPTAAHSGDQALEKGWEKLARPGDKPPEHNDRASGFP